MPIVINLGVVLAQRRMRSRELALKVGITEQNVSLLKSGKVRSVRLKTLARICEALQCQPGDLLKWQPDSVPASSRVASRVGEPTEV
jgi:putative transcriptional regulator